MNPKRHALLQELQKRKEAAEASAGLPVFNAETLTKSFPQQYNFITDNAKFKTACCSRRAGKTLGIAIDMLETCLKEREVICLYITQTAGAARNIIWGDLTRLIDQYGIECDAREHILEIRFPNKAKIIIRGANHKDRIEQFRGWKLRKVYIDECQSMKEYMRELIDNILLKGLRDLNGTLTLTGTPGPVPTGFFYEYHHRNNGTISHHFWTAFENPHMKNLKEVLEEEMQILGIDDTDPAWRRETYGEWVEDLNSLVFNFDRTRNNYIKLPEDNYEYIMGVDIGYNDADAIAVLAYSTTIKKVFLVEEFIKNKLDISELVENIKRIKKKYNINRIVMDAGALGKKIQEEINNRHGLNIIAAEKNRKLEYIKLLNDDLRTGTLKAKAESNFAEDCFLVQWEMNDPTRTKISDRFHSDITDAVLYAWRECYHYYNNTVRIAPPKIGTDEYMEKLEKMDAEQAQQKKNTDWWEEYVDDDIETTLEIDDLLY